MAAAPSMKEENSMLKNLSILKDEPLFPEGVAFEHDLDAFNHQAYAEALFKIIKENPPPLSIGLFGPWGIGKSTVVNILFALIRGSEDSKLKPVYFNAWKYSGDSFRRQFLIEVAKQVYEGHKNRDAEVRRLEQLNYTDVLREDDKEKLLEKVKDVFRARIRLRHHEIPEFVLTAVITGLILLAGVIIAYFFDSVYPLFYSLGIALLVPLVRQIMGWCSICS